MKHLRSLAGRRAADVFSAVGDLAAHALGR